MPLDDAPPPFDPAKPFTAAPAASAAPPAFDPSKPFTAAPSAPQWTKENPLHFEPGKTPQSALDTAGAILYPGETEPRIRKVQPPPKPEAVEAPDTKDSYDLSAFPAPPAPPGIAGQAAGEAWRGLERGAASLFENVFQRPANFVEQHAIVPIAAAISPQFGEYLKKQADSDAAIEAEVEKRVSDATAPGVAGITDVHGVRDALNYAAGKAGEAIPTLAEFALTRGAGLSALPVFGAQGAIEGGTRGYEETGSVPGAIAGAGAEAALNMVPAHLIAGAAGQPLAQAIGKGAAGMAAIGAAGPIASKVPEAVAAGDVSKLIPSAKEEAEGAVSGAIQGAVLRGAGSFGRKPAAAAEPKPAAGTAPAPAATAPRGLPAVGETIGFQGIDGPVTVTSYTDTGQARLIDQDGLEHIVPAADLGRFRTDLPESPAGVPAAVSPAVEGQGAVEQPPAHEPAGEPMDDLFRVSRAEVQAQQQAAAEPVTEGPSPQDVVAATERRKLTTLVGAPPVAEPTLEPRQSTLTLAPEQAQPEIPAPPVAPPEAPRPVAPEQAQLPLPVATSEPVANVTAPPAVTRLPIEPQRLVSWLKQNGGVIDEGGDIRHSLGGAKFRPGLVNNRRTPQYMQQRVVDPETGAISQKTVTRPAGMPLDKAANAAWEAGYFPEFSERPSINDLRDAIADDLQGKVRYSERDHAAVSAYQDAIAADHEIDRIAQDTGIDPTGLTREQFWDAVYDHMSLEQEAKLSGERYAAFERALADQGEEGRFVGKPRSLEDMEREYQQAQASNPARESPGGVEGPAPVPASEVAREAGTEPGGGRARAGRGPQTERTEQGEQLVIPGAERTAQQAVAARDQQGRGMMRNAAAQAEPGGLFAPAEPEQPGLDLTEGRPGNLTPQARRDTLTEANQFHASGDYPETLAGTHHAASDYVTQEGRRTGNEYFSAVDPSGRIIAAGTSDQPNRVTFSLQNPDEPPAVYHHNHPEGRPVSGPDLTLLPYRDVASITAHGHDGEISNAALTPRAREYLDGFDPKKAEAEIVEAAHTAEEVVSDAIDDRLNRGDITEDQANELTDEARNRYLAAAGWIDYVSTRELPKWLNDHLAEAIRRDSDPQEAEAIVDRLHRSAGALRPEDAMARISEAHEALAAGRPAGAGIGEVGQRGDLARAAEGTTAELASGPRGGGRTPPPPPPTPPPTGGGFGDPAYRRSKLDQVQYTDRRGIRETIGDIVDKIKNASLLAVRQYTQDRLAGLEAQEKGVGGGELLPASISPSRMYRFAQNSSEITNLVLKHGQVRYNPVSGVTEQIPGAKSLRDILSPLQRLGQDAVDDFKLWSIVKRAERLTAEDRERNVTPQMISEFKNLDKLYERPDGSNLFHDVHAEMQGFNKSLLDLGEASGVVGKAGRAAFERDDYVPFFRAQGVDDVLAPTVGRRGTAKSPIKELKGGTEKINDIFENLAMNASTMIRSSLENIAKQRTVTQLGPTAALTRHRAMVGPGQEPNIFSVLYDGKPENFQVHNPYLLRSIVAAGPATVDGFTRILAAPARLLRGAVVFDPAFMAAHNLRMAAHAYVLTGTSFFRSISLAAQTAARGLDETALKLMAAGAVSGKYDIGFPQKFRAQFDDPAYQNTLLNSAVKVKRFLQHISEAGMRAADLAPRQAVYEHAIKNGATEAEAIDQARDLLDFSTHGDGRFARFLAQTIPFLNARWQGIARTARGFAGEDRNSIIMRGLLYTGVTMALWAYNQENHKEEWDRLEDWDKQYATHIWIGGLHFRWPKFFELGALFGTLPEIMLDYMDNGSSRQFGKAMTSNLLNVFKFNPIPVAIRPIAEAYFNTDMLTGRPIVNEAEQGLVPNQRYGPGTSPSVVALTHAYNAVSPHEVSPEIVQHLLRGYLAGWSAYITSAADTLGESTGVFPSQPSWKATDYPVISRFVREEPEVGNRIQTDFYDLKAQVGQVSKSIKDAQGKGDKDTVAALLEKHPEYSPAINKMMQNVGKTLSQDRSKLNKLLANPAFSGEAKRKARDEFYEKRNRLMENIQPMLRQVEGISP